MGLLKPDAYFHRITDIPLSFFQKKGISFVVLDVDNTLTSHDNPVPAPGVREWLKGMEENGISFLILSNNRESRVSPFAEDLGLAFVFRGAKPLTFGLSRGMKRQKAKRKETALIGDQLFTDMLCGSLKGVTTVLVDPFQLEDHGFLRLKRRLERPFLKSYRKIKEET